MIACHHSEFATETWNWPTEPSLTVLSANKLARAEKWTPPTDNLSSFASGVRTVFSQLCTSQLPDGGRIRALGVTSCKSQEGKTTISLALSHIAAERQRILLINASEGYLNVRSALQGDPEARRVGTSDAVEQDTAQTPAFVRELLQELTERFDLIVVDLPSLSRSGCLEWAAALDGLLLVVQAEGVRWQVAARSLAMLEQAGGHVLGTIINKRRDYIPERLYRRL
jgi:Mrp family chromosome partitioning ATPase